MRLLGLKPERAASKVFSVIPFARASRRSSEIHTLKLSFPFAIDIQEKIEKIKVKIKIFFYFHFYFLSFFLDIDCKWRR